MTQTTYALNGLGEEIFAGIPVSNYDESLRWYKQLFGCPPFFYPNDTEAVRQIADHQWIYIIVDPDRAGHSIQNVMVSDLDTLIEQISERGLRYDSEELPAEGTRKVMYNDPDGNEIGLIKVTA